MLLHPRTPLIFGIASILLLAAYLAIQQPMPGPLAAAHGQVKHLSALSGCAQCHDERGLDAGCLNCHEEIAAQLRKKTGFHHHLAEMGRTSCQDCHQEHLGQAFPLVNRLSWKNALMGDPATGSSNRWAAGPEPKVAAATLDSGKGSPAGDPSGFDHPHLAFGLEGRHQDLACAACHRAAFANRIALPRFAHLHRTNTFLGLSQACIQCHRDVHAGGLSSGCDRCHGQESFRPAVNFDHTQFFKLVGAHERAACDGCHVIPRRSPSPIETPLAGEAEAHLPFRKVRGTTCAECHASPHRAPLGQNCESCHAATASRWAEGSEFFSQAAHAATGFRLAAPHQSVDCADCHRPDLPFDQKYPDPTAAGYQRRPETCQGCHRDVHAGQFAERYEGCVSCHDALRFVPHQFGKRQHAATYPLSGAHGGVPCLKCHRVQEPSGVRQFAGTTSECRRCHDDPHGGQFAAELRERDCTVCHAGDASTFALRPFDHEKQAGYALTGAHARANCGGCHPGTESGAAGPAVVRYRGTSTACASCHTDVHRGQFLQNEGAACERCHESTSEWQATRFDHNRQSDFHLTGVHAKVRCGACHPAIGLSGGGTLVQYKPLGKECKDCHVLSKY